MDEDHSTTPQQNGMATLFAKKARVMQAVESMSKDKSTSGKYSYNYIDAEQVASKLRKLMAENGLVLFASMVRYEQDQVTNQGGTVGYYTRATFHFTLACTDTGATWQDIWTAEAIDYGDKSLGKAATYAQKYYLMRTFLLGAGDDDDPDSVGEHNITSAKAGPRAVDKPAQPKAQHTPAKATGPRYEYEPVIAFTQQYLPERDDAINALKDMKKAGVINDGMTTEQVNAEVRRKLGPPLTDAEVAQAFEDLGKVG